MNRNKESTMDQSFSDRPIFEYSLEEFRTENGPETGAVVTGLNRDRSVVEVPEMLGGVPVRKIAPHAFSGRAGLGAVSFPASLRSIGAFALHNCPDLEEIALHDGITDYHNGVVRQDLQLRRVRLTVRRGNYMVMRDILSDTDARLCFCLDLPDGEARLLFPGYDYTFAENTMARTIQFSILGSGMVYRECVRRKGIGWREYDRLFPRVILDDAHAAAEIAADRLLFPYDLAPVHAKAYEDYLRDTAEEALSQFVEDLTREGGNALKEDACRRLQLMADRGLISGRAAERALRFATDHRLTQACGIILSGREAFFQNRSGQNQSGKNQSGQNLSGQNQSGHNQSEQNRFGQNLSGQGGSKQIGSAQNKSDQKRSDRKRTDPISTDSTSTDSISADPISTDPISADRNPAPGSSGILTLDDW